MLVFDFLQGIGQQMQQNWSVVSVPLDIRQGNPLKRRENGEAIETPANKTV